MAAVLTALAGCTDDTTGLQFATDPRPTREAATPTAVIPPARREPTKLAVAPRPFAELVLPRGAPDRIFFLAGPELWTVAAGGTEPERVFSPTGGESIENTTSSPAGDRVAILVKDSEAVRTLRVLSAIGEEQITLDLPSIVTSATPVADDAGATPTLATPVAADRDVLPSLDWSPQGDRVLVGDGQGGLIAIDIDESAPNPVAVVNGDDGTAESAVWSPTGEQVAYLSAEGDRHSLFVAGVTTSGGAPRRLAEAGAGRTVFDFTWLPDGRSLLFTEGDPTSARSTNADLWQIAAEGGDRQLVASAGSAAPVADIDRFAPSPDGRAVAYTVVVPGENAPWFHSLWVRDLAAGQATPISIPTGAMVTDLWWTSQGLVFRTGPDRGSEGSGEGTFELYEVGPDAIPRPILRATIDAATPGATPVPASA